MTSKTSIQVNLHSCYRYTIAIVYFHIIPCTILFTHTMNQSRLQGLCSLYAIYLIEVSVHSVRIVYFSIRIKIWLKDGPCAATYFVHILYIHEDSPLHALSITATLPWTSIPCHISALSFISSSNFSFYSPVHISTLSFQHLSISPLS